MAYEEGSQAGGSKSKIAAGVLGILLGWLGIHKFYLGYTKQGVIMLVVSLVVGGLTCGFASTIMWVIGLVEGIIYLTKSDDEFDEIYVQGDKGWF
jgi:TM2 domain-containing membrane protein YozV